MESCQHGQLQLMSHAIQGCQVTLFVQCQASALIKAPSPAAQMERRPSRRLSRGQRMDFAKQGVACLKGGSTPSLGVDVPRQKQGYNMLIIADSRLLRIPLARFLCDQATFAELCSSSSTDELTSSICAWSVQKSRAACSNNLSPCSPRQISFIPSLDSSSPSKRTCRRWREA